MKKALVSTAFEGEVIFEFDDKTGFLLGYEMAAVLSEEQQKYILGHLPICMERLPDLVIGSPTAKIIDVNITFEMFWTKYDDKLCSSKKRSQAKWDKMSAGDQIKAYKGIQRYFNYLPQGTRKKYAETYLNAELWNN